MNQRFLSYVLPRVYTYTNAIYIYIYDFIEFYNQYYKLLFIKYLLFHVVYIASLPSYVLRYGHNFYDKYRKCLLQRVHYVHIYIYLLCIYARTLSLTRLSTPFSLTASAELITTGCTQKIDFVCTSFNFFSSRFIHNSICYNNNKQFISRSVSN